MASVATQPPTHVEFAMSRIDEAERALALLTELGEAQAELQAMRDTARA